MRKKLALLLTLASSASAKIDYYVGIQAGAIKLKGSRVDRINLYEDSYRYAQSLSSYSSLMGLNIGISQGGIGLELEGNLFNARETLKQRPLDTAGPTYRNYHREFAHIGNIGLGVKLNAHTLLPTINVYVKPLISLGFFRTKVFYAEDMEYPTDYHRKTKTGLGGGLGVGIEKRIGDFKVGTEARYVRYRSFHQKVSFNETESGTIRVTPSTISMTVGIAYCF